MQFNLNQIQSFLGQSQKGKAPAVDSSNVSLQGDGTGKEISSEFASLLSETKALAKSGVTPQEFIETINTEELGLSGDEKNVLAKSFIDALSSKDSRPSEQSSTKVPVVNIENFESKKSDLASIIGTSKNKVIPTDKSVLSINSQSEGQEELIIDPKIVNGKLIPLKQNSSKNNEVGKIQSSEDFLAQTKVVTKDNIEVAQTNEAKSEVFSNKNKVLAFNKEQNTINNSIFSGKNPFTSSTENKVLNRSNDSINTGNESLSTISQEVSILAPNLAQSGNSGNNNQPSFGSNSNVQVLDFASLNTANTEQLISKISDYITTSRLEKQDHIELIVKHDSLGQIKVVASKGQLPDQINLDITANSEKGHQFFKSNEIEMIKSLSNSGVKLNDVKISMGSDFNFQSSDKGDGQFNQGHGSQNSRYNGQQASSNSEQGRRDRREQMWNMYRERMGA